MMKTRLVRLWQPVKQRQPGNLNHDREMASKTTQIPAFATT
jgi:hypothetical protein